MNNNETPAPVDHSASHTFGGIDDRCFGCDVRPGSRSASAEPCVGW